MPDWLPDLNTLGSISSLVGIVVTGFLYFEARKIRKSFLRRARLPEVNTDLAKTTSLVASHLKEWETDKKPALEALSKVRALLENVSSKLPPEEKRKVMAYLAKQKPRRFLLINNSISKLSEDAVWELYIELSGLVTSLQQLDKDSKWD